MSLIKSALSTVLRSATSPIAIGGMAAVGVVKAVQGFKSPNAKLGSTRNPYPLYDGHKPTSTPQKLMVAAGSALLSVSDPTNPDHIAVLGDITSIPYLSRVRDMMLRDPTGRQILKERPRIHFTPEEWEGLGKMPSNTFGYAYYNYMESQNISWETRTKVQYIDDEELAYIMTRHREIHDFYHTILGLSISVSDELTLKWFEYTQTGLPVGLLAGTFGSLLLQPKQKLAFYSVYMPWAIKCAKNAKPLFNVYWEKQWDKPIEVLRSLLNLAVKPDLK
ncbi:Ubiquinone biosynthesis protein [Mycoemilia scoparia]|uniref:4-hydroxy-3-methoxy-5-polyprenylbenzoate decarboxylase n=1 Tax=Mycoemilia scoparia TaxID=417184 RepID=A0A9W8DMA9_9FUNG|nr:Ubiquinone biosynthesis protein [Mycoemilia scoparia]